MLYTADIQHEVMMFDYLLNINSRAVGDILDVYRGTHCQLQIQFSLLQI